MRVRVCVCVFFEVQFMSVLHGPTQRGRSYHRQQLHTDETSDGVAVKEVGGWGGI